MFCPLHSMWSVNCLVGSRFHLSICIPVHCRTCCLLHGALIARLVLVAVFNLSLLSCLQLLCLLSCMYCCLLHAMLLVYLGWAGRGNVGGWAGNLLLVS
jgi:hypothetical protein